MYINKWSIFTFYFPKYSIGIWHLLISSLSHAIAQGISNHLIVLERSPDLFLIGLLKKESVSIVDLGVPPISAGLWYQRRTPLEYSAKRNFNFHKKLKLPHWCGKRLGPNFLICSTGTLGSVVWVVSPSRKQFYICRYLKIS